MVRGQSGWGAARGEGRLPYVLREQLRQSRGRHLAATTMRVAIEAASLSLSSGGLARYTSQLSIALARCFPEDEFFLISDQAFRMPSPAPPNLQSGGGPRNAMERRWWVYWLV